MTWISEQEKKMKAKYLQDSAETALSGKPTSIDGCQFHYLTEPGIQVSNRPLKKQWRPNNFRREPRKKKKAWKRELDRRVDRWMNQAIAGQKLAISYPGGEYIYTKK
jgi:hypothetical protein